jgi:hypothetical protein
LPDVYSPLSAEIPADPANDHPPPAGWDRYPPGSPPTLGVSNPLFAGDASVGRAGVVPPVYVTVTVAAAAFVGDRRRRRDADGTAGSTDTANVPTGSAAAALPVTSVTCPGSTATV